MITCQNDSLNNKGKLMYTRCNDISYCLFKCQKCDWRNHNKTYNMPSNMNIERYQFTVSEENEIQNYSINIDMESN